MAGQQQSILLTGASGYIGGTLLLELVKLENVKIVCTVRSDEQVKAVQDLGASPVKVNLDDEQAIKQVLLEHNVTIAIHTANSFLYSYAKAFIEALHEVKKKTGTNVHFLFTSGAKIFSKFAGIYKLLKDTDNVYDVQKNATAEFDLMDMARQNTYKILELGDSLGVRSYIYVPPIIYGEGKGFGNKISIQTVAVVQMAQTIGQVYQIADDDSQWPMLELSDGINYYMTMIHHMLESPDKLGYGIEGGYYFVQNGSVRWKDLYQKAADQLYKDGIIKTSTLLKDDNEAYNTLVKKFGNEGLPIEAVAGGDCYIVGQKGLDIGWKPKYDVNHLLSHMGEEVKLIVEHSKEQ